MRGLRALGDPAVVTALEQIVQSPEYAVLIAYCKKDYS